MIPVFIVTNKPFEKQVTYRHIPESYKKNVIFITSNQFPGIESEQIVVDIPLKEKRQLVLDVAKERGYKRIIMSDDDIRLMLYDNKFLELDSDSFYDFIDCCENSEYEIYSMHIRAFVHIMKKRILEGKVGNFYSIEVDKVYDTCRYDRFFEFEDIGFLLDVVSNGMRVCSDSKYVAYNRITYKPLCEERNALLREMIKRYPKNMLVVKNEPYKLAGKDIDLKIKLVLKPVIGYTIENYLES